ncbi:MAG: precorrin-4 C(11)-methyltransferase [Candidatus Adiutrix intracellularis]|nr:precorrin-4 C(11)-methyltransferase [Candidatus Adiutrix intracellularis]
MKKKGGVKINTPVTFVGAGPGDPDLITVAGRQALAEADLVVYAGSLVNPAILAWAPNQARRVDSAPLNLEQIIEIMASSWRAGEQVVRLHTGDPSLYGAIYEQIAKLKELGLPIRIVPGVTAALAGAAALGLEFTLPEITQTLIITRITGRTAVPESEKLTNLAAIGASMAIYLSAGHGREVGRILAESYGFEAPVALLYRVSWPDGRTIWTVCGRLAETLETEGLDRHILILVGPAVTALKNGQSVPKSKLYNAYSTHSYRYNLD